MYALYKLNPIFRIKCCLENDDRYNSLENDDKEW